MSSSARHRAQPLQKLVAHSGSVNCARFGPEQHVATGGDDRRVILWSLASPEPIAVLSGHASAVESVAFRPGHHAVAGGASSGTVKLWDIIGGKVTQTFMGHKSSTVALAFNPMEPVLASGSMDSSTRLWDLRAKKAACTLNGHISGVTSVQFSPDGRWLATGGQDGVIQIWDAAAGRKLAELASPRSHDDAVTSILFHPQQLLMASASADHTCKLWDVETHEEVASFGHDGKSLKAISFSPDGRALFTSHFDMVKVWGWEPTRCYDIVGLSHPQAASTARPSLGVIGGSGLAPASDMWVSEDNTHLLGVSLGHTAASLWGLDLTRVEPFGRNDVEDRAASPLSTSTSANLPRHPTGAPIPSPTEMSRSDQSPVLCTPGTTPQGNCAPTLAGIGRSDGCYGAPSDPLSKSALPDSLPDSFQEKLGIRGTPEQIGALTSSQEGAKSYKLAPSPQTPADPKEGRAFKAIASAEKGPKKTPASPKRPSTSGGRSKQGSTPRFLEPTVASRLRNLAKAADAAPLFAPESPGRTPPPERAPTEQGRSSPSRRVQSLGSRVGPTRSSDDGAEQVRRAKQGPMKGGAASAGKHPTGTPRMRSSSTASHDRRPWTPSILGRSRRVEPEEVKDQGAVDRSQDNEEALTRDHLSGEREGEVPSLARTSSEAQQLLRENGATAWTVPWADREWAEQTVRASMNGGAGPGRMKPQLREWLVRKDPDAGEPGERDGAAREAGVSRNSPASSSTPVVSRGMSPFRRNVGIETSPALREARPSAPAPNPGGAFGSPVQEEAGGTNSSRGSSVGSRPARSMLFPGAARSAQLLARSDPSPSRAPGIVEARADAGLSSSHAAGSSVAPWHGAHLDASLAAAQDPLAAADADPMRMSFSPSDPSAGAPGPQGQQGSHATMPSLALSGAAPREDVANPTLSPVYSQLSPATNQLSPLSRQQSPELYSLHSSLPSPNASSPALHGSFDLAAFAASCNATDSASPRMVSPRSPRTDPLESNPSATREGMRKEHGLVQRMLALRTARLQEVKELWGESPADAFRLVASLADVSVLADILSMMVTSPAELALAMRPSQRSMPNTPTKAQQRWQSLGLAGIAELLPQLHLLLHSLHAGHYELGLRVIQDVLRCYGEDLKAMQTVARAPGVDLTAEARMERCRSCMISIKSLEETISEQTKKRTGPCTGLAKQVSDAIKALCSEQ